MTRFIRLAAAALIAAAPAAELKAQERPLIFEFSLALAADVGNDMKAMRDGTAYTVGVSLPINIYEGLALRPHLTAIMFDGVEGSGLASTRPNVFGGIDVKKHIYGSISAFGGPLAMQWNQSANADHPLFIDGAGTAYPGSRLSKGLKIGARVGLDYEINDTFIVSLTWTVCEANKRFNPSWITLGGAIRF